MRSVYAYAMAGVGMCLLASIQSLFSGSSVAIFWALLGTAFVFLAGSALAESSRKRNIFAEADAYSDAFNAGYEEAFRLYFSQKKECVELKNPPFPGGAA